MLGVLARSFVRRRLDKARRRFSTAPGPEALAQVARDMNGRIGGRPERPRSEPPITHLPACLVRIDWQRPAMLVSGSTRC